MNPTMIVGLIAQGLGLVSMGSTSVRAWRTIPPAPQQQAQTQTQCPLHTRLEVVIGPNGQRQLACIQEQP